MKREIKFRAWDSLNNKMMNDVKLISFEENFCIDFTRSWQHNSMYWEQEGNRFLQDPILMQFTGLTDKNGKEIYENDILNAGESIVRIQFSGRGFEGVYLNLSELYDAPLQNNNYLHWSIIGNIHENPELL